MLVQRERRQHGNRHGSRQSRLVPGGVLDVDRYGMRADRKIGNRQCLIIGAGARIKRDRVHYPAVDDIIQRDNCATGSVDHAGDAAGSAERVAGCQAGQRQRWRAGVEGKCAGEGLCHVAGNICRHDRDGVAAVVVAFQAEVRREAEFARGVDRQRDRRAAIDTDRRTGHA